MGQSDNPILEKVYAARDNNERRDAYNAWSNEYDRDVLSFGIRLPFVAAAMFAANVSKETAPVLDAGCGTGMHTEPLILAGYSKFIGVDLSDGMLAIAKEKNIYDDLQLMAIDHLEFPDNQFAVSYCIGALAPGHAPPESLAELARVTKPNGLVIFSTHAHESKETRAFHNTRNLMAERNVWSLVDETMPFISMPGGDPNIKHAVYVYKVL